MRNDPDMGRSACDQVKQTAGRLAAPVIDFIAWFQPKLCWRTTHIMIGIMVIQV